MAYARAPAARAARINGHRRYERTRFKFYLTLGVMNAGEFIIYKLR